MGIQGLLPILKSIMNPIHIKSLEGCFVAIDTYSWLHKGAFSCSSDLCKGLPTSRHIDYCMHRVNLLLHYGVKPILVFDGGFLPMKNEQENKRARSRKENLARALEHESGGNSAAAYECYQKAVDITPSVAYELIQVLKREEIRYIVAPYEADAQMTFLAITKQVEAVITEDSDLIAFGCPRIIYKMDKYGQGVEFKLHLLHQNKDLSFSGFTSEMLLEMCILSGCDYLPSLPGMGLKRAHNLISKFKTFEKAIKHLRYSSVAVPPLYEESFRKAIWTFRHQRVYDPIKEDIVHLSDISDDIDGDLDFLGPVMPQHIVKAIAAGEVDPITKLPFQVEPVNQNSVVNMSYQLKDIKPVEDKKLELPAQRNVLTNYFCFASLEAKRKFRAPRVSPQCSDLADESSLSLSKEESGHQMNIEFSESENLNSSFDGSSRENPLEQPRYSIHKPCVVLRRERDHEHGLRAVSATNGLHKLVNEDEPNCRSSEATLKSSYIVERPDNREPEGKSKKVIVRSSYFKPKSNKASGSNASDRQLVKDATSVDKDESTLPVTTSFGNNQSGHSFSKRKTSPSCHNSEELIDNKYPRLEKTVEAEGLIPPSVVCVVTVSCLSWTQQKNISAFSHSHELLPFNLSLDLGIDLPVDGINDKIDVTPEEEKFGCKITHLGRYSDISAKSLDKFVSVISSFRYNSSGSRASGLRPPLKDVENVCRNRSSVDIGKFAYEPSCGKAKKAFKGR